MPFTLIKGSFAPELGRPDGDSMRFVADDPAPFFRLRRRGAPPKINATNGSIQLRYEAIDTMESRALDAFSAPATAANLDLAGTEGGTRRARGHLFSTQLGPHGRPIVFAFAGEASQPDGAEIFLGPDDIMTSLNVQLLAAGHAYPLFYDTLFDDLRQRCTEVTLAAQAAGRGVWAADRTLEPTRWDDDLGALPPIFPKLWRRLDAYARDETFFDPQRPLAGFKPWLEIERPERVSVPSEDLFTGFDNLVETTDETVRLTVAPHRMVIVSETC